MLSFISNLGRIGATGLGCVAGAAVWTPWLEKYDNRLKYAGEGGSGIVFRKGQTAYKVFKDQTAQVEEQALRRFQNDAGFQTPVWSHHIVNSDNKLHSVIASRAGKEDFRHYIHRAGPINEKSIRGFLDQILSILDKMHHKGVIHRDLKPANFLITKDGMLEVIDFGISHVEKTPTSLTPNKQVYDNGGTPGYMAPEGSTSTKADIYGIGMIIKDMINGPNMDMLPKPSKALQELINGMTCSNPKKRFNIQQVIESKFMQKAKSALAENVTLWP
tara:strand:- start:55 stop:876 length:822 start_codon:yes stop_codon:yes gene_type:complete